MHVCDGLMCLTKADSLTIHMSRGCFVCTVYVKSLLEAKFQHFKRLEVEL